MVMADKEIKEASPLMADVDSNPTAAGGVHDVYGEDSATEDQSVTPWSVSVARFVSHLRFVVAISIVGIH